MKSLDRAIERFCYRHPRFGIKNLMTVIVAGNVIVFLLSIMDTTGTFLGYLCFSPALILKGQIWRLVSFIFVPTYYASYTQIFFVAITLYFYYFIGSALESQWGRSRFNIYYFSGVLLSVIYGFIMYALGYSVELEISTYYVNMAMFFAFATMWPDVRVYLFFFIPIKMKWLALIDAALFIYDILSGATLFPLVAIANYLLFCGYVLWQRIFSTRTNHARRTKFKSAVHHAEKAQEKQNYRHKCSVCGRTDTDYPELEFRYCSRCEGYHCFCQDHINNHVHFKE
ncbi:MAG: rhomboid family intramembrane serine protease [Oscillospiraceae bacterium]